VAPSLVLMAVAASCLIPARRVTYSDPMLALQRMKMN
jgi:hypothetical protein